MLWNYRLILICYTSAYMSRIKKHLKIIAFDAAAGLCFIGVILFGWLPGPGGIPLFLLGLSLLAVNHDWAERWLNTAKHKGVTFKKWLFPDKVWVKNAYDLLSLAGIILGVLIVFNTSNRLFDGIGVVTTCFSLFIFLINRDRFDSFSNLFKRKHK